MTITLTLTELLLAFLMVAGVGVLISLMVLIINAIPSIKNLGAVLANAKVLTDDAVELTDNAKIAVSSVKGAVVDICGAASQNKNKIKSAINIAKAAASLKNVVADDSKSEKKK